MDLDRLTEVTDPAEMAAAVAGHQDLIPVDGGHDHGTEVARTATHAGHQIVVHTSYRIEIDGHEVTTQVGVDNDGLVHYHAVPNQQFASAIDMTKRLIDLFPDDFPPGPTVTEPPMDAPVDGAGHHHHEDHEDHDHDGEGGGN
jgi:hypothetical protein